VRYIVEAIGKKRLSDLTPADVKAVDRAVERDNSTSTSRRYRGTLERMLRAADAEGHDIPARVLTVKKPVERVNDRQAIPTPDVMSMLSVIETLPHRSRWVAAFLQGMRQGECLGLTWDRVDLTEESLVVSWQLQALNYADKADRSKGFLIPDGYEVHQLDRRLHLVRPKSKKGWRKYPLVPWMTQALAEWREIAPDSPHGLVWPALDGSPAGAVEDRAEWHGIQDAAGVRPVPARYYHVHEARHSTAMLLLALGVPESVRIQIMGHSSIASTRAYEHDDISIAREWLTKAAGTLQLS
jgi:integrase